MSEVEESVDYYLIFILFNRGVYMVLVFFAAIILLFLIRKYHRYEYKLHKCYFVSFALAMLLVQGFFFYLNIVEYIDMISRQSVSKKYTHS
jgi:hypothetical protein